MRSAGIASSPASLDWAVMAASLMSRYMSAGLRTAMADTVASFITGLGSLPRSSRWPHALHVHGGYADASVRASRMGSTCGPWSETAGGIPDELDELAEESGFASPRNAGVLDGAVFLDGEVEAYLVDRMRKQFTHSALPVSILRVATSVFFSPVTGCCSWVRSQGASRPAFRSSCRMPPGAAQA